MENIDKRIQNFEELVKYLGENLVQKIEEYRKAKRRLQELKNEALRPKQKRAKYKNHSKCPHIRSEHERHYPNKVVRVRESIIHEDLFPITKSL